MKKYNEMTNEELNHALAMAEMDYAYCDAENQWDNLRSVINSIKTEMLKRSQGK